MALIEDLTFMLGDSGVVLNTDSSSLPFVDVLGVIGLDNANYRESRRDREGSDGGYIDAEFEQARDILINGEIYADSGTMETYLDSLKYNYAPSSTVIPFYIKAPGVDERVVFVKPLGCKYDWDQARRLGIAKAQFKMHAEDPRIYSATLTSTVIGYGGDAGIGIGFNLGFDFGFGASLPNGANLTNSGNRSSPPIFIITGPVVSPVIISDTLGKTMAFNITLSASDTLTIDMLNKTVLLNGSANRRNSVIQPNWFFLEPGSNFIRYGGTAGTGSSVTVQHRSAWR